MKTKAILLITLLFAFSGSAWADVNVTLSVDSDIPEGTAGHWFVNLGRNSNYDKVLTLTTDDLAAGQNVFKVYDDGGKSGNYSSGCQSKIVIYVPAGYVIQVSGTVWMYNNPSGEYLKVYDGEYGYSPSLATVYSHSDGEAKEFGPLTTTDNALRLYFTTFNHESTFQGLDLTVMVYENKLYNISVASGIEHGTIVPSATTAYYNNDIDLTVTPAANYHIGTVSYNDGTDHVIQPVDNIYSFKMPQHDVTVIATFLDDVTYHWGEGNDGSAEHPYVISNKAGWDLLVMRSQAALVAGNSKYYRLDADISGVTAGLKYFDGHLDGNHHKMTFTDAPGGIITQDARNATFSNLTIEGSVDHDYVFDYPPILTNCFVNVSRTGDGGFIRLFYSSNFYGTNCAYLLEGIPALFASGENVTNPTPANAVVLKAGAFAVRTSGIAIGDGDVTLYADGFSYGGTEYYQENATVVLGRDHPSGYSVTDYSVSGATLGEGNTFTMPSHGVTVTATGFEAHFIDADGTEQTHDLSRLSSSEETVTKPGGWYAVVEDVTISQGLTFSGDSYLIVAGGVTLTAERGITIADGATLTVLGPGSLIVNGMPGTDGEDHHDGGDGVAGVSGSLIVNGGTVHVTGGTGGTGSSEVYSNISQGGNGGTGGVGFDGSLIVNGGTVHVIGGTGGMGGLSGADCINGNGGYGGVGIRGSLTVNGGTVHVYGGTGGMGGVTEGNDSKTGSEGGMGKALDSTVACTATGYVIQESKDGSTWYNLASGSTSTKIYVRVIGIDNYTLTARQATFAGQSRYWSTFYHPDYCYLLPAGAQAFTMGSDHALYRIGDGSIIPAGCAVVIMADSASVELTATSASAPSVTDNILQGTSAATAAPSGARVMSQLGETFGFFLFVGTIPANKAYYVE